MKERERERERERVESQLLLDIHAYNILPAEESSRHKFN